MHGRLLFVYMPLQSCCWRIFTANRQICQSQGQDDINVTGLQSRLSNSCPLLSWLPHLGHESGLGIQLQWDIWIPSQSWLCPCAGAFILHQLGMWLTCGWGHFKMTYYHACFLGTWSNKSVFFSFCRTVNNFLMTGPKVNPFYTLDLSVP